MSDTSERPAPLSDERLSDERLSDERLQEIREWFDDSDIFSYANDMVYELLAEGDHLRAELAAANDLYVTANSRLDDALVDLDTAKGMATMFRDERDAALEIVRAVATSTPTSYVTHRDEMRCASCGEYYAEDPNSGEFADIHEQTCIVEQARALLAQMDGAAGADGGTE